MNIFIAFANQDREVRDKMLRQMNLVKDRQGWNIWSAKEIKAGERWDEEIKQRLMDSEVVILLLSTDFFNSKYIVETELPKVIEKHKAGDCQIIPVIARVCHWKDTPFGEYAELGDIQALPVGEKPIMSKVWNHEDDPYFEVVAGIKDSIKGFQAKKREIAETAEREKMALDKQKKEAALAAETQRAHEVQREREAIQRQKEENERVRQAESEARERTERERRDAEQLTREEQARHERTTEEIRRRNEQAQVEKEQLERLVQRQQEQEKAYSRADSAAWLKASNVHDVEAYQMYLSHFPQGEMIREARNMIKELKRENGDGVPWSRYLLIGSGILALVLSVLWGANIFSGESESQLSGSSTNPSENLGKDTSHNLLPENTTLANTEKKVQSRPPTIVPSQEKKQTEKFTVPEPINVPNLGEKTYEMFDIQKEPSFPGGLQEMYKWLNENVPYPESAKENAISGQVVLTFIVGKDGGISNVKIVKEIGGGCGNAVKSTVKNMPKWSPGEANGRPVNVIYTLPFKFKLE